jgi:flagellar hook-basal body complex protein FliE
MGIPALGTLEALAQRDPPTRIADAGADAPTGGFGALLGSLLDQNARANAAADIAVNDLVTGKAQDLHTVAAAVAQADLSFRLILEMRNRATEAFQEVTRMQI